MDPKPPAGASKLRLMCSYGGHIVPRPHDKSLFYAGGETRIVSVDRRTIATSLPPFTAHLSRAIFSNRQFHLKYQLPNEDLDSLISVVTDEDLVNMLEEHDWISVPERIRLFLFPVKPESLGISLLDSKSESWFCDALNSTGIVESGGGGREERSGAESLVLETSLSFGSTTSSVSMSNSPPIGFVQCEDNGLSLMERKIRVLSSASIESDNSVGSSVPPSKPENFQEPLIQVDPEASSTIPDPSSNNPTAKNLHPLGYPLSQPLDSKNLQNEPLYTQHYVPQYNQMPIPPYYQTYQMPLHQQQPISCPPNQAYPIYLVPVRPSHYHNMSMQCNIIDSDITGFPSRPPLPPPIMKEVFDPKIPSEPVPSITMASPAECSDFEEDIVYNQIYKTQPLPPGISSQYTTMTNHAIV